MKSQTMNRIENRKESDIMKIFTMKKIKRIYVAKKEGYNVEDERLLNAIHNFFGMNRINKVRLLIRYDLENVSENLFKKAIKTVFVEEFVDEFFIDKIPMKADYCFGKEYLPGQYDQRADSARQCLELLEPGAKPIVKCAQFYLFWGELSEDDQKKLKHYLINPVDSCEASLKIPQTLGIKVKSAEDIHQIKDFLKLGECELQKLIEKYDLAMNLDDIKFIQEYFRKEENRSPTLTELKVLDTYWSDHCRHTTFWTEIEDLTINDKFIQKVWKTYLKIRLELKLTNQPCLMDLAQIALKYFRFRQLANDVDLSEEINACSIRVKVKIGKEYQDWLLVMKNETHNHPTEIEPFGGAATCLGGAIRDPLASRAFVYQAMRLSGCADPFTPLEQTLPGKLPQRKITTEAALGFSSYGNQVGLATGLVHEFYHPDYVAKRMEVGAVLGAVQVKNIFRQKPLPSDLIVMVGGRTGRDGVGGATGSSVVHSEQSLLKASVEVQKGDPVTERKLLRLFRRAEVIRLIKRCNDFGAGGVAVAIGEIAEGVEVQLDNILKKYEGLDGTELTLSESQERMAVVISKKDLAKFMRFVEQENLEATVVGEVKAEKRLNIFWRNKPIVSLNRTFLDSKGVPRKTGVLIETSNNNLLNFSKRKLPENISLSDEVNLITVDYNQNVQKGLIEMFDGSIGAGTVLFPLGGKNQMTPAEAMAALLPTFPHETTTVSLLAYGFNPHLAKHNHFWGAFYAGIEAISKIAAAGGNYKKIRFSLQEYFPKLGNDPRKWGITLSAMLGAFYLQYLMKLPAIGGKDSMSGTFKDLDVVGSLIFFAFTTVEQKEVLSPEIKSENSFLSIIPTPIRNNGLIDLTIFKKNLKLIRTMNQKKKLLAIKTINASGWLAALIEMIIGNGIGVTLEPELNWQKLAKISYGSFIIEHEQSPKEIFNSAQWINLGRTNDCQKLIWKNEQIEVNWLIRSKLNPLSKIFPVRVEKESREIFNIPVFKTETNKRTAKSFARPLVLIPVFPGTNCEYDTARAFLKFGAKVETFVFRNITPADIDCSIKELARLLSKSQIVIFAGGFSAGDEPAGSAKFITSVLRNQHIKDEVHNFLYKRDGLMLGICNGFQALLKVGLLPFGKIEEINAWHATLTYNEIGRHVSQFVNIKIVSNLSPWFLLSTPGEIKSIPVSHGEGRFVASQRTLEILIQNKQIATQYVDPEGNATLEFPYNPNGSMLAIEGITSPDGRILGKMAHNERSWDNLYLNIPGEKEQNIFASALYYFS